MVNMRQRFEAWFVPWAKENRAGYNPLKQDEYGNYLWADVICAWAAWQACHKIVSKDYIVVETRELCCMGGYREFGCC